METREELIKRHQKDIEKLLDPFVDDVLNKKYNNSFGGSVHFTVYSGEMQAWGRRKASTKAIAKTLLALEIKLHHYFEKIDCEKPCQLIKFKVETPTVEYWYNKPWYSAEAKTNVEMICSDQGEPIDRTKPTWEFSLNLNDSNDIKPNILTQRISRKSRL